MTMITAAMLRLLSTCHRRVWLDSHGDQTQREPLQSITVQRLAGGNDHERAVHQATAPRLEWITVRSWQEGVTITRDLMQQNAKAINGAFLETTFADGIVVRCKIDRLVHLSSLKRPIYAPVEIKKYTQLTEPDLIQMDLYVWLLCQLQNEEPPAEFWLGRDMDDQPLKRIRHDYDESRLMNALHKAADLLQPEAAQPPVILRSHCKECHWYGDCKKLASETLDISLLSNLRQDTRQHFQKEGITSLEQIAAMQPDDLRKFKGIKSTAHGVHASARAWVNRQPVWYNTLDSICDEGGWMFDIETEPMTGIVWCIGWSDDQGNSDVALVAPHVSRPRRYRLSDQREIILVPDSDAAWETFAQHVGHCTKPIFHWTGFDAGVMRGSAPDTVKEALTHRLFDLHKIVNQSVKFPVKGTSIKTIAGYMDFKYTAYQAWDAAFNDYNLWLSREDVDALTRACSYQRDDVIALLVIWRWLIANKI